MTGNDLGIVFYSLHNIFSCLSHNLAKRCSIQQNIEGCTWMCLQECFSLISERPAIATTAFRDLPVKMCDQLGGTTHWISFVLLVFVSHWVSLFHQDRYCNLNKSFGLMSHDARQFPRPEVIVLTSLWSVAPCLAFVLFLKVFYCSQNGPRYGLEVIASVQGNTCL